MGFKKDAKGCLYMPMVSGNVQNRSANQKNATMKKGELFSLKDYSFTLTAAEEAQNLT